VPFCYAIEPRFSADSTSPTRQAVVVTDPVLATSILRSRHLDKLRFQYSFLDPVRTWSDVHPE
jgi:hypothetical protein